MYTVIHVCCICVLKIVSKITLLLLKCKDTFKKEKKQCTAIRTSSYYIYTLYDNCRKVKDDHGMKTEVRQTRKKAQKGTQIVFYINISFCHPIGYLRAIRNN
jgi:hypothetical protein